MVSIRLSQNQLQELQVDEEKDILSSLRELGKDPVGDCGGEGACGKCKARLMMGFLSPVTELEKTYLTPMELSAGWFLMCQRRPVADIVIDVPQRDLPQYDFQRQPLATAEKFNPAIQKVVFTMQMLPGLDLEQAFLQSLACPQIQSVRLFALQQLMELMEQQPQKMTAVIAEEDGIAEVIGVELGDTSAQQYGVAVDFGAATIGLKIIDLAKGEVVASGYKGNGLRAFGNRLIKTETVTEKTLQQIAICALDDLLLALCDRTGVFPGQIYQMMIAGNSIHQHILLGILPKEGFAPAFLQRKGITAKQLGFSIYPEALIQFLPNLDQTAGGDCCALQLAMEQTGTDLLIDLDTTTQVIYQKTMTDGQKQTWVQLVNDTDVLDGMGFSTGMTASQGAIVELLWQEEQQDIQAKWLGEFEFKGLCGYGLVHIAKQLLDWGILLSDGTFADIAALPEKIANRIKTGPHGKELLLVGFGFQHVVVQEQDFQKLFEVAHQVAVGIEKLLQRAEVDVIALKRIVITGSWGSDFAITDLQQLGFFPENLPIQLISYQQDLVAMGAELALLQKDRAEATNYISKDIMIE